jgi:hypothetical protein
MSAVIYSNFSREIIISIDPQTIPKISLTPTPLSIDTSFLYNLWIWASFYTFSTGLSLAEHKIDDQSALFLGNYSLPCDDPDMGKLFLFFNRSLIG